MKLALETDSLDAIADRIRTLLKPETPTSFMDKLKLLPMLAEVGSFFPKVISAKDAPCKQVIHRGADVDLLNLPILKTWPQDGGPFITLPCVITRDPKSGKRNVGMYRMQVYDGQDHRHALAAPEGRRRAPPRPPPRHHHRLAPATSTSWPSPPEAPPPHPSLDTLNADHRHQDPRRPHGGRRSHRHRPRHHLQPPSSPPRPTSKST